MSADVFKGGIAPLVLAYHFRSSPIHIGFWCPWCKSAHLHGAVGGDGGRVAHCGEKTSPLFGRGIDLIFAGTIGSWRALPQMAPQEMAAFSNYGFGAGEPHWKPAYDDAGDVIARPRVWVRG